MTERIAQIRQEAERAIAAAEDSDTLEQARIRFLGRKAELPNLLRRVAELPPEERAATGKAANQARQALEQAIERKQQDLEAAELQQRLERHRVDVTLLGDPAPPLGHLHLITQTRREIEDIFIGLGFDVAEGPEVETVYYNFDALNHTVTHPARAKTDTFYVKAENAAARLDIRNPEARLLRTHTSPMQIRSMESQPP